MPAEILALAFCLLMHAPDAVAAECRPAGEAESVTVRSFDARGQALLTDGTVVVLAEIGIGSGGETVTPEAAALLQTFTSRPLSLIRSAGAADRHGRVRGWLMDGGNSAQTLLVTQGQAQYIPRSGDCAAALRESEQVAREAGRGLWGREYGTIAANDAPALHDKIGRYVILQGTVLSARRQGNIFYLNFGRRGDRALSAAFSARLEKDIVAGGTETPSWTRRPVRVRGWLEWRDGPIIQVTRAEQVELLERARRR